MNISMSLENTLAKLQDIIKKRVNDSPDESYVAKLISGNKNKIAQKVGEEAVETAIAAAENDKQEVIKESADLIFHLMILWEKMGIIPDDIYQELQSRFGISGIEEKKRRNK